MYDTQRPAPRALLRGRGRAHLLTDKDRRFLVEVPRLGLLTVDPPPDTWPAPVPVWFDCTDTGVELFSLKGTPKLEAIERRPYASLMAVNHLDEPEAWVSVAGPARVEPGGAFELAERLAPRYWDLSDPSRARTLASWGRDPNQFVRISITAEVVRRYGS